MKFKTPSIDTLFDDSVRNRTTQADHSESKFNFLNTSSLDWVSYVRNILNLWYTNFPKDLNFYRQFTSKRDNEHLSALFELFTFTVFQKIGFEVAYHYEIGDRKVDLCLKKNDVKILLDCAINGEPNFNHRLEKISNNILDAIESIHDKSVFINVNFIKSSNSNPSTSKIIKELNLIIRNLTNIGKGHQSQIVIEDSGWEVEFEIFKKRKPSSRVLGANASIQEPGFVEFPSMEKLRTTLDKKRGKNYLVNSEFIIAVNPINSTLLDSSIKGALYGHAIDSNLNIKTLDNSFFYSERRKREQNTSVSGVIIVKNLFVANFNKADIQLWINPWAKYSLNSELFPFKVFNPILRDNKIVKFEKKVGKTSNEILGIKLNYLIDNFQ